jgi:hypothetical protein
MMTMMTSFKIKIIEIIIEVNNNLKKNKEGSELLGRL